MTRLASCRALIAALFTIVLAQSGFSNASLTNVTSPQVHSQTSTSVSPENQFPYLIPYNQSQSCDIYGPICQTGLVTVDVSLNNTQSTATTLPCSSYLAAQSTYLELPNAGEPGALFPRFPVDWLTGFGRSPQCKSYGSVWSETGEYTLSECGPSVLTISQQTTDYISVPSQLPPGVLRKTEGPNVWSCCGNCSLQVQEIRLYYFPDENASAYCQSKGLPLLGANETSSSQITSLNSSSIVIAKRAAGDSVAVLSGHTFTSPSLYLEIVGTAAISDQCGTFGNVLTNPFVTLAPGQLSTYSIQSELEKSGQCYVDIQGLFGYGFQGFAKPLNVADLACPTFGLGPGTDSDGQPCRTIGPPYLPLIIPPSQVLSLDPGWLQSCKGLLSYAWGLSSFAIYDPPRTLQPASALVPPEPPSGPTDPGTTQDSSNVPAATSPVQPGQAPAPSTPTPTAAIAQSSPSNDDPGSGNAPQDPNSSEGTQAPSGSDPSKGNPSSNDPSNGDPSNGNPSNGDPSNSDPFNGDPSKGKPSNGDPSNLDSSQGSPDINNGAFKSKPPETQPYPPSVVEGNSPEPSQGLGGLIMGGLGPNRNPVSFAQSVDADSHETVLTIGGQTFVPNQSGFNIAGITVRPGAAPISVAGIPVSLDPSGAVFIGGSKVDLPPGQQYPTNTISPQFYSVGGELFSPAATGFRVVNSQILPGGSAIQISGTRVSLGTTGDLVIGSSTVHLPAPTPAPANVFRIGGSTVTANLDGFSVVGGPEILPGSPAVLIYGTRISLGVSGNLVIGSSTVNLLAQTPGPSNLFHVGDETFTANPTGFSIAGGSQILPGGTPAFVSGTPLSLDTSGVLHIGSASIDLANETPAADIITIAGQTIAADPSGFLLDGDSVAPGGTPVTISGTAVSLGLDGELHIGTGAISLAPLQTPAPGVFTVDGLIFTSEGNAVVVDGATLTDGGRAVTLQGTIVSLEADGSLVVGGSTVAIPGSITTETSHIVPGGAANGTSRVQPFEGGQGRIRTSVGSMWVFVLAIMTFFAL